VDSEPAKRAIDKAAKKAGIPTISSKKFNDDSKKVPLPKGKKRLAAEKRIFKTPKGSSLDRW